MQSSGELMKTMNRLVSLPEVAKISRELGKEMMKARRRASPRGPRPSVTGNRALAGRTGAGGGLRCI
jgi:hypothetical protein